MTIHLNKVNGFGGGAGGGGGDGKFPIFVTSSGSSLPSASGFQFKDTFLDTTDKKIYTAIADAYEWNTNITNSSSVTVDFITGTVTNISNTFFYRTFNENLWTGTKTYQIKFKLSSIPSSGTIGLLSFRTGSATAYWRSLSIKGDVKKIRYTESSTSYGSGSVSKDVIVLDTELETDVDYTIVINKSGQSCQFVLSKNNTEIEQNTINDVTDFSASTCQLYMGEAVVSSGYGWATYLYSYGQIYLLESSGEFLKASSELSWDNGAAIEDKTEYADKTNGILYLYENDELVNIPQKNTLSFTNVSASSWVSDSTYTDYGYKCELSCSGVTANMFAQVIFAPAQADSGNYATVCLTGNGTVTIYSKVNDTISIPSIVVMGV